MSVLLNLKWYQGEDLYSEGDAENLVAQIVRDNPPEDYAEALETQLNWSTYYHLTQVRQNILNWYPFEADCDLLEIGCGMGAITGMLCERCGTVTAVELSKRRAGVAASRCGEYGNLEIIVGNLNDIEFERKFDYITLIGVLEYQGSYTESEDPYFDFLCKIRSLLKPRGKLLIAIENRFGLKYWCGAREDHTNIPFDGIGGYRFSQKKVKTFSHRELEDLIRQSGFSQTYFYYPMPDYKLPDVVYSQDYLPRDEGMDRMAPYYIPDDGTLIMEERWLYKDLLRNQVFPFFANSYLVVCGEKMDKNPVVYAKLNSNRLPEYRICTRIRKDQTVEKFLVDQRYGVAQISAIQKNEEDLIRSGIAVVKGTQKGDMLIYPQMEGQTVEDILCETLKEGNIEKTLTIWDILWKDIERSSELADKEENLILTMKLDTKNHQDRYGKILKMGYVDMHPGNGFWKNGEILWIDQEWNLENIPAGYVMYRAIVNFYIDHAEAEEKIPIMVLQERYGLKDAWEIYGLVEEVFVSVVVDKVHLGESRRIKMRHPDVVLNNIVKLIT